MITTKPNISYCIYRKIVNALCVLSFVIISGGLFPCVSQALVLTPDDNLQVALDTAKTGEKILLSARVYFGNFLINNSIELVGQKGTVIDGMGNHDALRITAPDVTISQLDIRNWGDDLTAMNAGIFVESTAHNVLIVDNRLKGDVTGIWLEQNSGAKVLRNHIQGNTAIRSTDRGNGVQLNLVTDAEIRGNEIWHTRDGLYIISSQNNVLIDNYIHDLRYGIHYMYSHSNRVENNFARNTRAGYALMQSRNLTVTGNRSESSQDYGILLNFITYSELRVNSIDGVIQQRNKVSGAAGKALFVYNSLYNDFIDNRFSNSEIGIHLTAGSEDNRISGNSFINNPVQVKYVSTRAQEWSHEQRGNYWSNYLGWDMDNDGRGDIPFEPNDDVDKLLWKYPEVRILMNSPALLMLRWVQRLFPVLKSPGIKDSYPLMKAPSSDDKNHTTQPNLPGAAS